MHECCIYFHSTMAEITALIELLLSIQYKLPCLVLGCVYVFVLFVFTRDYFIIGVCTTE
jgi:hypothetical protein